MSEEKLENSHPDMSIGGHIDELRVRIIRCVVFLLVSATIFFIYKGMVLDIIFGPLDESFPTNRFFAWFSEMLNASFVSLSESFPENKFLETLSLESNADALKINTGEVSIVSTKMAGQFNLHVKSSIIAAIIVSVPFILWQIWSFVKPALSEEVQIKTRYFVIQTSMWFFIGLSFGYFVIAPLAVNFLTSYNVSSSISNMIDVSSYLSNVMGVSFAAALIFQLPLIVKLLSTVGVLQSSLMRKYRKVAFAVIVVISAVITPPDVFSQILLAIPLYGLYEYGIVIASRIERKKALQIENN